MWINVWICYTTGLGKSGRLQVYQNIDTGCWRYDLGAAFGEMRSEAATFAKLAEKLKIRYGRCERLPDGVVDVCVENPDGIKEIH